MITGRPPFSGDSAVSPTSTCRRTRSRPGVDPSLPETLEAITLKTLAKNPANRYPSAQDLRADLRRYLDGNRILAEPVLAHPWTGRHRGHGADHVRQRDRAGGRARGWPQTAGDGYGDYDEDYYDEDQQPKRSKWFLARSILVLVLAGLLYLLATNLGGGDDETPQVEVPNVVGQPLDQATTHGSTAARLRGRDRLRELGPARQRGHQAGPPATTEADEGSTVALTFSGSPEAVPVPASWGHAGRGQPDPHRCGVPAQPGAGGERRRGGRGRQPDAGRQQVAGQGPAGDHRGVVGLRADRDPRRDQPGEGTARGNLQRPASPTSRAGESLGRRGGRQRHPHRPGRQRRGGPRRPDR